MELSDPKIEKVLNFLKNSFSFIWKMELFKRTSYISEGNFLSSKNKKTYTEKNSYISRNGTFCPKHIKFFIFFLRNFFFLYFRRELAKPEKISYPSGNETFLHFLRKNFCI